MSKPTLYRTIGLGVVAAGILAAALIAFHKPSLRAERILAAYDEGSKYGDLAICYPLNDTLFPPEIAAPTFRWKDSRSESNAWLVRFQFQDDGSSLDFLTRAAEWTPSDEQWEAIKRRSVEKAATVTVIGVNAAAPKKVLSSGRIAISTSRDEVGAPLFFREVNLPFIEAVKDPSRIRWRFGTIDAKAPPTIILEGLPVCGNCHSFTADGRTLGMDVDYANDKGSYVITRVEKEITLAKSKVVTWSDYKREDRVPTYGLLSQISPDGRYTVSTVKDRSVFVAKPGIEFSQLFFPIKGILAFRTTATGTYSALPGADDKDYVQSNPSWSPGGKYIVFARSATYPLKTLSDAVLLTEEECREFLKDGKPFLFDLYRIPFNDGKGGTPVPLEGASHNGMSNYFARYSPDGKWIVFCKSKSYMLLQPDSELYIVPAAGGPARKMRCNTPCMNSWHTWSPNGKWLVFSSKANGPYTQLFLTHVDAQGNDTPAVVLDRLTSPDRAANIPEFVNTKPDALRKIRPEFVDDVSFVRAAHEYFQDNDYDGAARSLRKALELNPDNFEAQTGLGFVLTPQGKLDEAIAHLTAAVRLNPASAEAQNALGFALAQQGKDQEAVAHYKEAVRLNPAYADARNNLGLVLTAQGNFAEAVVQFTEAIRLRPAFAEQQNNLGYALTLAGRYDEAVPHFNEAIRLNPDLAEPHNNLAFALAQQGKLGEAIFHYSEAIRLNPTYADAHNNLGMIFEKQGKLEEAISHFARAVEINPNHSNARLNLQRALEERKSPGPPRRRDHP